MFKLYLYNIMFNLKFKKVICLDKYYLTAIIMYVATKYIYIT